MKLLTSLEFAFGAFLIVFVAWQIVAPMLQGNKPFPAFRKGETNETTSGTAKPNPKGGK